MSSFQYPLHAVIGRQEPAAQNSQSSYRWKHRPQLKCRKQCIAYDDCHSERFRSIGNLPRRNRHHHWAGQPSKYKWHLHRTKVEQRLNPIWNLELSRIGKRERGEPANDSNMQVKQHTDRTEWRPIWRSHDRCVNRRSGRRIRIGFSQLNRSHSAATNDVGTWAAANAGDPN